MVDNGHLFIACADQWLEICELQMAGKKRMDARAFLQRQSRYYAI
jgi:methionyl-tRNA formyltransferase